MAFLTPLGDPQAPSPGENGCDLGRQEGRGPWREGFAFCCPDLPQAMGLSWGGSLDVEAGLLSPPALLAARECERLRPGRV